LLRKRIQHKATFEEQLAENAIKLKEAAEKQPPGSTARELLAACPAGRDGCPHRRLAAVPRVAAAEVRPVRGNRMSGYYAYFTGNDGHITSRVTILAANDEEAKERAKQLVDGQ
jgi:hypothetical protein